MSTRTAPAMAGMKHTMPIALLALVIGLAVQFIGSAKFDIGIGSIIVFPMVWGLILGLLVSIQKFKPLGLDLQKVAAALVGVAVMLLVARLAFNIGPSLPVLVKAGPALLLQEIGHLLGTVFLALPLAVLLRMGKATVGATFSLDREPSFAMVSEKYGPDSDQYRGVLAMYVQSGRRVSVYALAALGRLARGQCTLQQAMDVIARRERERELNRARQARLRARKKLV